MTKFSPISAELSVYDKVFTNLWRNEKNNNLVNVLQVELFPILRLSFFLMSFLFSVCILKCLFFYESMLLMDGIICLSLMASLSKIQVVNPILVPRFLKSYWSVKSSLNINL